MYERILQKYFGLKGDIHLAKPKVIGVCYGENEYQIATDKALKCHNDLVDVLCKLNEIMPVEQLFEMLKDINDMVEINASTDLIDVLDSIIG